MSARSRWFRLLICSAVVALAVVAALPAAGSAARSSSHSTGKSSKKFWTSAEVNAKVPGHHIAILWNVPKKLPQHYTLGFVNWSATFPFFATWADGMQAAAKLFGVSWYQVDAKFDQTQFVNLYNGMEAAHHLNAVGFGATSSEALVQAATANGVLSMSIDASTPGSYGIGVDSPAVGKLAGNFLGPALKQKLAGPWKGSKVLYLVINTAGCATCIARTDAELATLKKYASISATATTFAQDSTSIDQFVTNTITAHPGWKFIIASQDDENQASAIPALQAAGVMNDTLIVSLGGDSVGQGLLRSYPKTVIGAVDFNPWAEGFNWVVATIAALEHKHFAQYPVKTVLTPANVNKYYPPS